MKKSQVITLFNLLDSMKTKESNSKFSYVVAKNKKIIQKEIEVIEEVQTEMNKLISEFSKERNELITKLGEKNENGTYEIKAEDKENINLFIEEEANLKEKYKDNLDSYHEKLDQFEEILQEEIEFDLYKIKDIEILPDFITPEMIEFFMGIELID
jgi:hypothetical protein